MAPRMTNRVAWQSAGDEAVIIDLDGRKVMGLNATGSLLWMNLDGQRSAEDLAALLVKEFSVPLESARADVNAFLDTMVKRGFVTLD